MANTKHQTTHQKHQRTYDKTPKRHPKSSQNHTKSPKNTKHPKHLKIPNITNSSCKKRSQSADSPILPGRLCLRSSAIPFRWAWGLDHWWQTFLKVFFSKKCFFLFFRWAFHQFFSLKHFFFVILALFFSCLEGPKTSAKPKSFFLNFFSPSNIYIYI